MPRPNTKAIEILDAVVTRLEAYKSGSPDQWLNLPVTIKRFVVESDIEKPRPVVLVRGGERETVEGSPAGEEGYYADLKVFVHGIGRAPSDPEAAGHGMAADIQRALILDYTLGGSVLRGGYVVPTSYDVNYTIDDGGAGEFEAVCEFSIRHRINQTIT